jgi:hypothetical protein
MKKKHKKLIFTVIVAIASLALLLTSMLPALSFFLN